MKLAMTPPDVSSPNDPGPYPTRSHSQRTTSSSTNVASGPGVPDVDALVGHLREQLAHHRDRQRRRREVAELARVLRVHLPARQAVAELVEDRRRSGWARRAPARDRPVAPKNEARNAAYGAGSPIARCAAWSYRKSRAVAHVSDAEPLQRGARRRRVAVADQLRFGVPRETLEAGRSWTAMVAARVGLASGIVPSVTDDDARAWLDGPPPRRSASRTSSSRATRRWPTRPRSAPPTGSTRRTRPTRSS